MYRYEGDPCLRLLQSSVKQPRYDERCSNEVILTCVPPGILQSFIAPEYLLRFVHVGVVFEVFMAVVDLGVFAVDFNAGEELLLNHRRRLWTISC